jgi:hypothetical protein
MQVASFAIVVNQLKSLYDEFFVSVCDHCRGTGCVTCPHCHGTKTLRRRPGFIRTRDLTVVDNPVDSYQCFYCGPPTKFDFNPFAADDEPTALKVAENLKAAVANIWPRPFELGALAGTVPCPQCNGSPRVRRLTPDFGRALGMDEPWDFQIAKRWGTRRMALGGGAPERRFFLEYPGAAPAPVELPAPMPKTKVEAADGGGGGEGSGFKMSQKSAFSLEDYVLNYASDDDYQPPTQQ